MADVIPHPEAFTLLLREVSRSVLTDLSGQVADIARTIAPVRARHTPIPARARHPSRPGGGSLKASVVAWEDEDADGPVAYVGSLWYGRFLDPRARQLHRTHPFLPTSLYEGVDGRTINL